MYEAWHTSLLAISEVEERDFFFRIMPLLMSKRRVYDVGANLGKAYEKYCSDYLPERSTLSCHIVTIAMYIR